MERSAPFRMPHAIIMMLLIIVGAVALTYVVPSGAYQRGAQGVVRPGTYRRIRKDYTPRDIVAGKPSTEQVAYPASPVAIFSAIPVGMQSAAALIFMILFIGGMFGVLEETGALNAGIERLLVRTRGNVYLLAPMLMIAISAGSTFLGLISEYLVIIPLMVVLAERLQLDALFGTAMVAIAAKIGYMTSVTNPLPLVIAQPIVGLPVFSGLGFRLVTWIVYLAVGITFLLLYVRRRGYRPQPTPADSAAALSRRHLGVLVLLIAAIGVIVYGAGELGWGNLELGAFYLFVAFVIALVARLSSRSAATAFLSGVRTMVLAALLVGLARAVEVILRDGLILDTIIETLAKAARGRHPVVVAQIMVLVQMAIDVLIPSTSGQAAVTMPILGPIGHLAGVSPQVSVSAFIFGNGLSNTVTPTSGMLLAYLATGKVPYGTWVRFAWPLVILLLVLSLLSISVAVLIGV